MHNIKYTIWLKVSVILGFLTRFTRVVTFSSSIELKIARAENSGWIAVLDMPALRSTWNIYLKFH